MEITRIILSLQGKKDEAKCSAGWETLRPSAEGLKATSASATLHTVEKP
jgi:hypothetical protein